MQTFTDCSADERGSEFSGAAKYENAAIFPPISSFSTRSIYINRHIRVETASGKLSRGTLSLLMKYHGRTGVQNHCKNLGEFYKDKSKGNIIASGFKNKGPHSVSTCESTGAIFHQP